MQHSPALKEDVTSSSPQAEPDRLKAQSLRMADRSFPRWAKSLVALFTLSQQVCLYGLTLLAAMAVSVVAQQGELSMAPVFFGLGVAMMVIFVILCVAQTRAMRGYRQLREAQERRTAAYISITIFVVLTALHPLAGTAILLGAGLGYLAHYVLAKASRPESLWEAVPSEAVAILAGRDQLGAELIKRAPNHHALSRPINVAILGVTAMASIALGSALIAEKILNEIGLIPLVLASVMGVEAALRFMSQAIETSALDPDQTPQVFGLEQSEDDQDQSYGLTVSRLNVLGATGTQLLANIDFSTAPGGVTGLMGESGAGKSLLLKALADPFALSDMEISGYMRLNGSDPWVRAANLRDSQVVYLSEQVLHLPASGAANLSCFQNGEALERGKSILERLVFSSEVVTSICETPNANHLPQSQSQSLALARAFLIGPQLYLLDRPETGLSDKQISALADRICQETRLGRSFVIATENRVLSELCDRLIVMQYGRVIDQGPAELVHERISTGWSRFTGNRLLETEDNLIRWVHSHFRRGEEEANKRRVGAVASDLLLFSCAHAGELDQVGFSFKHFEGYCILRLEDKAPPIRNAQFERARQEARNADLSKDASPLAAIFQNALEVEKGSHLDNRTLEVKIKTFDPRKLKAGAKDGPKPHS